MNTPCLISPAMRDHVGKLCDVMQEVSGYDPRKRTRLRPVFVARAIVCDRLLCEGWTEAAVACVMNMNHSTVHYYREVVSGWEILPGFGAERDLLDRYLTALHDMNL